MNRTILLLQTFYVQIVSAQTACRPLVEEGKIWTTKTQNPFVVATFFISGDTIVDGEHYKKVFWDCLGVAYGKKDMEHMAGGFCFMLLSLLKIAIHVCKQLPTSLTTLLQL